MSDFQEIIKSSKPTLVDFFATWCGPCKMQSPILEKVKEKVGDVRSVPTLILFKDGEPVWRTVGVQQADLLEAKIFEHVPTKSDE